VRHRIAADLALADHYEVVIGELELAVLRHDISRFPSVRDFASYCRLVKCERSSAGKSLGTGGNKIGNAYLKWAFSESAVLFIAKSEQGRTVLKRLERKYGKPKALSVLAHKLGRAVYYMLARKQAFDPQRFAAA
jgi:transposase